MEKRTAKIKKCVKLMGNVVCALSILFVLAALMRTDFDFSQVTDWRIFLFVFAVGTALKTVTVFLSASAWCLWLEFFAQKRCDRTEALRVYAKANIGKYLPGNVMHYVERNLFAEKLEMSQKQIAAASICEVISLVLAASLTGAVLAFSHIREVLTEVFCQLPYMQKISGSRLELVDGVFSKWKFWLVIASVGFVLFILGMVFRRFQKFKTMSKTFFIAFFLYTAVLFILGWILVLLYWYLGGRPSIRKALEMVAAYMIAWVLGFIVPGAPGGIGVREMVLTLLLTPVTGQGSVAVLSVLHRLITVAGDFVAYLVRRKL